mmetsp:Transcript_20563/g.38672  ORF Transcript_20563/g.38672 Transcript_20563/m.38672 type:complete len:327 (-) Transcript_20563:213-1193(-)
MSFMLTASIMDTSSAETLKSCWRLLKSFSSVWTLWPSAATLALLATMDRTRLDMRVIVRDISSSIASMAFVRKGLDFSESRLCRRARSRSHVFELRVRMDIRLGVAVSGFVFSAPAATALSAEATAGPSLAAGSKSFNGGAPTLAPSSLPSALVAVGTSLLLRLRMVGVLALLHGMATFRSDTKGMTGRVVWAEGSSSLTWLSTALRMSDFVPLGGQQIAQPTRALLMPSFSARAFRPSRVPGRHRDGRSRSPEPELDLWYSASSFSYRILSASARSMWTCRSPASIVFHFCAILRLTSALRASLSVWNPPATRSRIIESLSCRWK